MISAVIIGFSQLPNYTTVKSTYSGKYAYKMAMVLENIRSPNTYDRSPSRSILVFFFHGWRALFIPQFMTLPAQILRERVIHITLYLALAYKIRLRK